MNTHNYYVNPEHWRIRSHAADLVVLWLLLATEVIWKEEPIGYFVHM